MKLSIIADAVAGISRQRRRPLCIRQTLRQIRPVLTPRFIADLREALAARDVLFIEADEEYIVFPHELLAELAATCSPVSNQEAGVREPQPFSWSEEE